MKKKALIGLVTVAGLSLTLAACGGGNGGTDTSGGANGGSGEAGTELNFSPRVSNTAEAIEGQTLEIAQVSNSDFPGIFSNAFYSISIDMDFFAPANESLFLFDEDLRIIDGGAASIEFDEENKQVRVTLNDGIKWNDGEDVTADDLIFPYEVIGHADYSGVRYDGGKRNIVGMEEYHEGEADTISGIEKVNDKEIVITFKEFVPSMLQGGGPVLSYAMPKHVFEGIEVKDMEASDPVRKNPVTIGPYYIDNIVPGESVSYLPNEFYYGETPKLDRIVMTKVPTAQAVASIEAKEYDIYSGMPTSEYTSWQNAEGYEMIGQQETAYNYIAFKLGHFDTEENKNVMDPDAKMGNNLVRQAIGYAIDNDTIAQRLYNGLQQGANSLIVPVFGNLHDADFAGFTYDPEKANELLDEAGYVDVNDDGIREDADGNEFTINFAFRDGGDTAQALAEYYIQQWEEVGLNVELATGRLIEVNAFYEQLQNDEGDIDMYQAGWGTGFDPNQEGLYGELAQFNMTRYVSEKNTELINKMSSEDAFDADKAKEIYSEWQQYAFEQAFVIPTTYSYAVLPVHERVVGYDVSFDVDHEVYATVGVSAESR